MMADLDALRVSWTALAAGPGPEGRGLATLPLDHELPCGRPLLGRDLQGQRHLLIPRAADEADDEDRGSDAVQIAPLTLGEGGAASRHTDVVCRDPDIADVFDDLILAMLRDIERADTTPSRACIRVLEDWRHMLRPPAREPLSINQTAGLIAELHTAIDILRRDPVRRIDVWTGPAGGRHDFRRGTLALEVKETLSTGEPSADIHGIEQLEAPDDGELHLAWLRLERVPGGSLTIAGLIETLRRLVGGAPQLYDRLIESGWRPEGLAAGLEFELRERRLYAVAGPFPRLVPGMLLGGVPAGVSNVRYSVALSVDGVAPLDGTSGDRVLTAIATAGTA